MTAQDTPHSRMNVPINAAFNAMSIDVEDYFQVWALSEKISRDEWDGFSLRVEASTRRALTLFDRTGATATFFTLGWVAERCPQLIRDIVAAGHEIASHGMEHIKVFDQTKDEFRGDAGRAKKLIEDISGVAVTGYRAAGFSIDQRTPWAHEVLTDLGYRYSSSLHPIQHDHYGAPDAPRFAHRPVAGSDFIELPVSTANVFGRRVSCAGGGWFRAMPYAASRFLIDRMLSEKEGPAVFYFHPWEIDPGQPRIEGLSTRASFRHYLNLDRMESKLEKLLRSDNWARIDQVLAGLESRQEAA